MPSDLHESVRAIVNASDPVGLLAMGAPEDEYEPEITDIVALVVTGQAPTTDVVRGVFIHWFGKDHGVRDGAVEDIASGLARLVDQGA